MRCATLTTLSPLNSELLLYWYNIICIYLHWEKKFSSGEKEEEKEVSHVVFCCIVVQCCCSCYVFTSVDCIVRVFVCVSVHEIIIYSSQVLVLPAAPFPRTAAAVLLLPPWFTFDFLMYENPSFLSVQQNAYPKKKLTSSRSYTIDQAIMSCLPGFYLDVIGFSGEEWNLYLQKNLLHIWFDITPSHSISGLVIVHS